MKSQLELFRRLEREVRLAKERLPIDAFLPSFEALPTDFPDPRDDREIDRRIKLHIARMDFEDRFTAVDVGPIDYDLPIEAAGPQQGLIQNFRRIRRRHDDDARGSIEAIHLGQELVQRLFPLIITEKNSAARRARLSDSIEFIDKDDARRAFLRLFK